MTEIRYVECDAGLKRQIGEVMGELAERHIRLEDGYAFVALDGETPVGLIAVYRRQLPDPLAETDEGFINIIEVAESHRRQGIARRLVEMSIDRCRKEGRHQLRAWSSCGSADEAIRMWKALGFGLCPATEHPRGQEVKGYFVAHKA
jgi:GNAT superfamily N-acetyltransferase